MSYSVILRTGCVGLHSSLEAALESAESAYASSGAEFYINDEVGTVTYRLHGMTRPQE